MEEILLDDSDDEFCQTPPSRKIQKGVSRRKINKKFPIKGNAKVVDEFIDEPPLTSRTRSSSRSKLSPTKPKKDTTNEEKFKNILSKVMSKTNSTPAPVNRASSLAVRGKENAEETQSAAGKPTRSVSDLSTSTATSKKRKLTEHWKKAKTQLTPTLSPGRKKKKFVSLNDSDDDDFVDEKMQKGKRVIKTKGSKGNDSFDIDAIFNSDDDTIDATDTTIEIDEEFENDLEQINVLKLLFNAQVKPKGSASSEKIKRGRSSDISKSITKKNNKKKKKIQPAAIISRGPMDCFDDLITETTRGFPCNFCSGKPIKLQKRRDMIQHMQSEHSERLSEEQKNIELAGLFRCDVDDCGLIVRSKYLLRTHTKAHAKIKHDGCDTYYKFYLEIQQTQM